jgi:hypothetical protein
MRLGIPLQALALVPGQHEQQIQIRPAGQEFASHGAAVQQNAFQLRTEQRRGFLHVSLEQLLNLGGDVECSRLSHKHLCRGWGRMLKNPPAAFSPRVPIREA